MISSAHLSLFRSNAPPDLAFTERQSQPIPDSRRSPHDLRFVITSRRLHYGDRFWVTMPYLLHDQINWSAHSSTRWRTIHGIGAAYGLTILACAFTQY